MQKERNLRVYFEDKEGNVETLIENQSFNDVVRLLNFDSTAFLVELKKGKKIVIDNYGVTT